MAVKAKSKTSAKTKPAIKRAGKPVKTAPKSKGTAAKARPAAKKPAVRKAKSKSLIDQIITDNLKALKKLAKL